VAVNDRLLANGKLILESYAFDRLPDTVVLKRVANSLAKRVFPEGPTHEFFRKKLAAGLVLLNEAQFSFFVRNSTVVEPHVRIDDTSGTADDGGLFFSENLPPESLIVSLAMASIERRKKGDGGEGVKTADDILNSIVDDFNGKPLQIGGDATTGRGQVIVRFVGDE
jgi:CRISPR-associated protein Cmr4